jgi:hypothetical protein
MGVVADIKSNGGRITAEHAKRAASLTRTLAAWGTSAQLDQIVQQGIGRAISANGRAAVLDSRQDPDHASHEIQSRFGLDVSDELRRASSNVTPNEKASILEAVLAGNDSITSRLSTLGVLFDRAATSGRLASVTPNGYRLRPVAQSSSCNTFMSMIDAVAVIAFTVCEYQYYIPEVGTEVCTAMLATIIVAMVIYILICG